ncbi:unnamed protein product [Rhizophagus irregularis]|uniref:DDE-1 domain-containing protein n=1 Tax=Rhizophagus irregularis TaxID=588596 RepID=A0A915ZF17_9GLOM|nr:unnamed protein product [Rhizophagus irregularis]
MDRKILLLIDNAGSHFNPKVFEETNSDLSESDEEVAESSHSAQNRKKAKKKVAKKKPDIKLTNIEFVYLPPNTTAHLQPMDAGIIHSFKAKYKREFCNHIIHQFDRGINRETNKLNIKEAIDYIAEAWENVTQTTIRNCWVKTGILPSSDCIIDDVNMQGIELNELDELNEINLDLLPEADDLREYFHMLDHDIPTEEHLTDEQIINLLQDEGNESNSEGDISDDEEAMLVTEKKGVEALKTFINYFEQQNDPEFNIDELHVFRKYLRILKVREFNSKHQTTLDIFFKR